MTSKQIRATRAVFAGAAAVATVALFSAAPADADSRTGAPPGATIAHTGYVADGPFDDNGESGDIFQQNAQDQSTA